MSKRGDLSLFFEGNLVTYFRRIDLFNEFIFCDIINALGEETMDRLEEIKHRLAEVVHKENLDTSLKFKELGLDSLDIVELLLQLEEEYGIHFDDVDMNNIVTVQDLLDSISKQLN